MLAFWDLCISIHFLKVKGNIFFFLDSHKLKFYKVGLSCLDIWPVM